MTSNSNAHEQTHLQATPDSGAWEELPLHIGLATVGATGSARGFQTDSNGTTQYVASIGAAGGVTAGGGGGAAGTLGTIFVNWSLIVPQVKCGDSKSLLQSLNATAAGLGPFAELLLCLRARAGSGNEDVDVFVSWLEGYAAASVPAAWRISPALNPPTLTNNASAVPGSYRWVNVPLLRPDIVSGAAWTATQRDAFNDTYRNNNLPTPLSITVQNRTALAANEFIDILGGVLRYRKHDASRLLSRVNNPLEGFTNSGTITAATDIKGSNTF